MRRARWSRVVACGVVGAQAAEAELRGGETGGGQVEHGVASGLVALIDDGDQAGGEACLILKDGLSLLVVLQGDKGKGGVFGYGLFDIGEGEERGFEAGMSGADRVDLGGVVDERLRGDGEEGGRIGGVSVGVAEACAYVDGGNVDVLGLGDTGSCLFDLGLRHFDAGAVADGEIDGGREGELGAGGGGEQKDDEEGAEHGSHRRSGSLHRVAGRGEVGSEGPGRRHTPVGHLRHRRAGRGACRVAGGL